MDKNKGGMLEMKLAKVKGTCIKIGRTVNYGDSVIDRYVCEYTYEYNGKTFYSHYDQHTNDKRTFIDDAVPKIGKEYTLYIDESDPEHVVFRPFAYVQWLGSLAVGVIAAVAIGIAITMIR